MRTLLIVVIAYLVLINIVAYIMMALDKSYAKRGKWRIPEATLLGVAFIGGSLGELLGMTTFRHKTKHLKFTICVPLFLVIHIALIVYLAGVQAFFVF